MASSSSSSASARSRLPQPHTQSAKNRLLTNVLDAAEFNQLVVYVSSNARARALSQLMEGW